MVELLPQATGTGGTDADHAAGEVADHQFAAGEGPDRTRGRDLRAEAGLAQFAVDRPKLSDGRDAQHRGAAGLDPDRRPVLEMPGEDGAEIARRDNAVDDDVGHVGALNTMPVSSSKDMRSLRRAFSSRRATIRDSRSARARRRSEIVSAS